jgi:phosphoribosyl 1,2-cyclic phosphodiesterase
MTVVDNAFPYLTSTTPPYLDETTNILERRIALLKFQVISDWEKLTLHHLPIQCFPVYHGGKYVSLGFAIGDLSQFVYISDVKIIPKETFYFLKSIPKIKILIVDALDWDGIWSHTGMEEAIEIAASLNPEVVYFTGISCGLGLHHEVEEMLQLRNPSYHLAYDGLLLHLL